MQVQGIFPIVKPVGWTSFDVVNKLRRLTGEKKIGHSGTLDPMATGVLVVAIGREYTKQLQALTELPKTYLAQITFGITTDTYDLEGAIVSMSRPLDLTRDAIEVALNQFRGEIMQKPPIYSALKINGRKLYEYARRGQTVEIVPRSATVYDLKVLSYDPENYPTLLVRATVSKGTYIRSLAYDLGVALGVGGGLSQLVRESVGSYLLREAYTLDRFN